MSQVSAVSFQGDKVPKKEVVYVSKNPDRAANATGVVAGTAGMVGGAVLGGTVGIAKIPGEIAKGVAGVDYAKITKDTFETMKNSITSAEQVKNLRTAWQNMKNPETAEELVKIMGSMSTRLQNAFTNDPDAMRVINGVVDPIIEGISVKKNFRSYVGGWTKLDDIKSVWGQNRLEAVKLLFNSNVKNPILKLLGANKPTSKIIGSFTENFVHSIEKVADNVKNFTPAEKEAWGRVMNQIGVEFEKNPRIKSGKEVMQAMKALFTDNKWLTGPMEGFQKDIKAAIKNIDTGLTKLPIKTIGMWSAIGAVACGTLSTLGWFGLKSMLMRKETAKTDAYQKSIEA